MNHSDSKMLQETKTRNGKEREIYRGLAHRMQSIEFLCDLGLM